MHFSSTCNIRFSCSTSCGSSGNMLLYSLIIWATTMPLFCGSRFCWFSCWLSFSCEPDWKVQGRPSINKQVWLWTSDTRFCFMIHMLKLNTIPRNASVWEPKRQLDCLLSSCFSHSVYLWSAGDQRDDELSFERRKGMYRKQLCTSWPFLLDLEPLENHQANIWFEKTIFALTGDLVQILSFAAHE